jgi:hypothetical protein
MLMRMKETVPGSLDGIHQKVYKKGEEYPMESPAELVLAKALVDAKVAEEVEVKMAKTAYENKAEGGADDGGKKGKLEVQRGSGAKADEGQQEEVVVPKRGK